MRPIPLVLTALLLAGCSGKDTSTDDGSPGPMDGADDGSMPGGPGPGAMTELPMQPTIYINGTLDASVAGCPAVASSQAPDVFPGDVQAVDAAAWNRTYTGPSISTGANTGEACLVWLDGAGAALDEQAAGTVPEGAAEVAVFGTGQVGADYSIRIG
jgi:hypothetical protein